MDSISYIQAADLHLDTPFKGLTTESLAHAKLAQILIGATFKALDNLVRLAINIRPDFILLAGDIYNQEDRSIRAQLALVDACQKLADHDIPVFICHGNHDPLSSRFSSIKWPGNVTIFSTEPETFPVIRNGKVCAEVHGISHGSERESRNLSKLLSRSDKSDIFQIGLLHCSIESGQDGDRYAPCSLEDLYNSRLDAWALGHIHEKEILSQNPFIAYSGNTQGLHINEPNERGCYLVKAEKIGADWQFKVEFFQLSPVVWKKLGIDIGGVGAINDIEDILIEEIEKQISKSTVQTEAIILRIKFTGSTELNDELRSRATQQTLISRLEFFNSRQPSVWIKDFEIATTGVRNLHDFLSRDDLVGETVRFANTLLQTPSAREIFVKEITEHLYKNSRCLTSLAPFDEDVVVGTLEEAAKLCQRVLEDK